MTMAAVPPAPDAPPRRWRRMGIRLSVSVGLLALLVFLLPWDEVVAAASRMTVPLYVGALVAFLAAHSIGAVKWRVLIAASGRNVHLGPRDTAGCYGAGLFSNLFLPTVVGGDVVRAALAMKSVGSPEAVILGSMADRLIDFAALGLLIGGGALFAGSEMAGWSGPFLGILAIVALGSALLLAPLILRRPLDRWPPRFRGHIARGLVALRHLGRRPGAALLALTISLLMQSALITIAAWLGDAVGALAPLWAWFLAWPLAKAAGMLPVSFGGLGVRDAALASLLVPFGVPAAIGLVASLAWQTVMIGAALIGGLVWWLVRPGSRTPAVAS